MTTSFGLLRRLVDYWDLRMGNKRQRTSDNEALQVRQPLLIEDEDDHQPTGLCERGPLHSGQMITYQPSQVNQQTILAVTTSRLVYFRQEWRSKGREKKKLHCTLSTQSQRGRYASLGSWLLLIKRTNKSKSFVL